MHIFEESLNRFIKNSWIYYEANDPYYAGKIVQISIERVHDKILYYDCLLYTSPSPRDAHESRMPSSA